MYHVVFFQFTSLIPVDLQSSTLLCKVTPFLKKFLKIITLNSVNAFRLYQNKRIVSEHLNQGILQIIGTKHCKVRLTLSQNEAAFAINK